ncbi:MAG: alpha/beta hydrolase [Gammaproteobacteria bacterium]
MFDLRAALSRAFQAALAVGEIGGVRLSPRLDRRPDVRRDAMGFMVDGELVRADRYRPSAPPRATLLLVHGAAAGGKDDPRLVRFATTLARARLLVVVPDMPALRRWQLLPEEAPQVTAALRYLRAHADLNPTGRIGLGAFSVAVGPAAIAASRVPADFILAVGGYYDLPRTLNYLTTGHYHARGGTQTRKPNAYGKWVTASSYADRLDSAHDRELLRALAEQKLHDRTAEVGDLARALGPQGRAVYAFITNTDPARTDALRSQLPEAIRADIETLDLARHDLAALRTRWIIVHGRDDDIIPCEESEALAAALKAGGAPHVQLFILNGLGHVERKAHARDGWTLWRAILALLAASDGAGGPG